MKGPLLLKVSIAILTAIMAIPSLTARTPDEKSPRPTLPPTPSTLGHLPGTIIIKLQPGLVNRRDATAFGIPELDRILDRYGVSARRPLLPLAPWEEYVALAADGGTTAKGYDRIYVLNYTSAAEPMVVADALKQSGLVEFAEPYYTFTLCYTPNDPRIGEQYWLSMMEAQKAWDITKGDTSIAIGIIDTGLDWLHPDLAGNIFYNRGEMGTDGQGKDKRSNGIDDDNNGYVDDYVGWDFIGDPLTIAELQNRQYKPDNNPAPRVNNGPGYEGYHGTAVGGCASASTNNNTGIAGIGFNTRLIGVKCAADSVATNSVISGYDGIRYAADRGARVINCSWGGNGNPAAAQALQAVIDYAYDKGALVVASSGNAGTNNDQVPQLPADLNHVLSVGATTNLDSAANFSQYGVSVDVWAAGVSTLTTFPGGAYSSNNVSGTSFSCPIISGLAALVFSVHPNWNPEQVAMQLRVTGDRVRVRNPAFEPYFYRRANAFRAVSINRNLADGSPTNLPGLSLVSYTVNGTSGDTITSLDQSVSVHVTLKNWLAPGSNIKIEALANQTLTLENPVTIASIATLAETTEELFVKISPSAQVIYSEGNLQLILKVSSNGYEDIIPLKIPISLPGWHGAYDPTLGSLSVLSGTSIHATSSRVGWALANQLTSQTSGQPLFARTVNGRDWQTFRTMGAGTEQLYCIFGLDDKTAWTGSGPSGGASGIFKTINGGGSWERTSVAAITPFVDAIHFYDKDNGVLIGDPLSGIWGIGLTTDGGATWSSPSPPLQAPTSEAGWNNSYAAYGDHIWFGTNNRRIYHSSDRGFTWSFASTGTNLNSLGVAFANEKDGLALFRPANTTGAVGFMVSRDGGKSWTNASLPRADADPQGIAFVPGSNRAFLATQYGVFETSDFAATWKQMAVPLYSMAGIDLSVAYDSAKGYVAAYGLTVYSQVMVYRDTVKVTPPISVPREADAQAIQLGINIPNPVTHLTTIPFEIPQRANVEITIHDPLGLILMRRDLGRLSAGSHSLELDLSGTPAGSYFYTINVDGVKLTRRMTVVR